MSSNPFLPKGFVEQNYSKLEHTTLLHRIREKDVANAKLRENNRETMADLARVEKELMSTQEALRRLEATCLPMRESLNALTAERSEWLRLMRHKGIITKHAKRVPTE